MWGFRILSHDRGNIDRTYDVTIPHDLSLFIENREHINTL